MDSSIVPRDYQYRQVFLCHINILLGFMEGKKKIEDKMVQIAFKRQRQNRDSELIRLNRNEREMIKKYCAGLGVTHTQGLCTEFTRLHSSSHV